jgi:hypothetical protein
MDAPLVECDAEAAASDTRSDFKATDEGTEDSRWASTGLGSDCIAYGEDRSAQMRNRTHMRIEV